MMHFDDYHISALMKVYADICFKIQFQDKISLISELVLRVDDDKREYRYSLSQVLYHSDKDVWLTDKKDVSVQTGSMEEQEAEMQYGNDTPVIIKQERDTEMLFDNITSVTPSSPDGDPLITNQMVLSEIPCPLCSDQFQDESAMAKHLRDSHDIGNMYVCTVCTAVCWSNKSFIQHMKEHPADKRADRRKQTPKKVEQGEVKLVLQEQISTLLEQNKANVMNIMSSSGLKKEKTKHAKGYTKLKSVLGKKTKTAASKKTARKGKKETANRSKKKIKKEIKEEKDDWKNDGEESDATIIEGQDDEVADPDFVATLEDYKDIKTDAEHVVVKFKKKHECSTCGKVYTTRKVLRRHISTAHMDGKDICDLCGQVCKGRDTLKRHIRALHKNEKPYKCTIPGCEESFHFNNSLKMHILKHTGERPHVCSVCCKSYLTSNHLKVHYEAVHAEKKNFVCRFCGKEFSYATSHKMHEKAHAETSKDRPYLCDSCPKRFVNRQALKYHVMAKHTEGHFPCDVCHKVYKTEFLMKTHMRRHTDANKRFMCDICGSQFMYKSTLELHKSVHSKTENNYECKTCGKWFKTYPSLYSHQYVHKEGNPFECSICKKAFKTKERCKAHERRHSGLKPFECSICQHCFPDKGGLQKHMKTVHCSVKKFSCDICGKTTSRADNLRVHMKVHAKPGYEPKVTKAGKGQMVNRVNGTENHVPSNNCMSSKKTDKTDKQKICISYTEDKSTKFDDLFEDSKSSDMLIINPDVNDYTTLNSGTVTSSNNGNSDLSSISTDSVQNRNPHASSGAPVNVPLQIVQSHDVHGNPPTGAHHSLPVAPLQPTYMYPWPYVYQTGVQPNQSGSSSYFQ